jgi:hypothetical protein
MIVTHQEKVEKVDEGPSGPDMVSVLHVFFSFSYDTLSN